MRHLIHKIICWYLRKCGGAFHCYQYGPEGRYVVLMTDDDYSRKRKQENALLQILYLNGDHGDDGFLDKFTREKCIEALGETRIMCRSDRPWKIID